MTSLGFIHKISYSTEITKRLASEGSGQTHPRLRARNSCLMVALLSLHTLPALISIFHTLCNQLPLHQLSFGFISTNHPGQNSLSR